MRKTDAAVQRNATTPEASRDRASRELVCLALILAVSILLLRIASIL
jgi:hypothetical protein